MGVYLHAHTCTTRAGPTLPSVAITRQGCDCCWNKVWWGRTTVSLSPPFLSCTNAVHHPHVHVTSVTSAWLVWPRYVRRHSEGPSVREGELLEYMTVAMCRALRSAAHPGHKPMLCTNECELRAVAIAHSPVWVRKRTRQPERLQHALESRQRWPSWHAPRPCSDERVVPLASGTSTVRCSSEEEHVPKGQRR